jgi:hypothetical protein
MFGDALVLLPPSPLESIAISNAAAVMPDARGAMAIQIASCSSTCSPFKGRIVCYEFDTVLPLNSDMVCGRNSCSERGGQGWIDTERVCCVEGRNLTRRSLRRSLGTAGGLKSTSYKFDDPLIVRAGMGCGCLRGSDWRWSDRLGSLAGYVGGAVEELVPSRQLGGGIGRYKRKKEKEKVRRGGEKTRRIREAAGGRHG